jgi:hypothetical protein
MSVKVMRIATGEEEETGGSGQIRSGRTRKPGREGPRCENVSGEPKSLGKPPQ